MKKQLQFRNYLLFGLVFIIFALGNEAKAQIANTWSGTINTDWAIAGNWSAGVPTNTHNITIPTGLTNYPVLSAAGVCRTIAAMGAGSSISGIGPLTISNAATTIITGSAIISCPLTFSITTTFSPTNSSDQLTISGIISGTGALTKAGSGILILSGENSYSGTTTISAGTLKLGATGGAINSPLGTISGGTSISTGGILDLNGFTLGTAEPLTLTSTGTAATLINSSASAAIFSGNITMAYCSWVGTPSGDITLSGVISGGYYLVKLGTGTLTLSNSNTYTGATYITSGTLKLGVAGVAPNSPLGTTAGITSIGPGAVLDLNGFSLATAEVLYVYGTGISNGGALTNSSVTAVSYSGLLRLYSTSSIIANAGAINLTNTGLIYGSTFGLTLGGSTGGSIRSIIGTTTGTLTKVDAGIWTLSGSNTYTGATTITSGTLKLGTTECINDASPLTVNGILDMGGFNETVASLAGVGTITSSTAGSLTFISGGNNSNTIFSGNIQDGSATSIAITKTGTGILTLSGNSSYSGQTTISAGTIKLGASGGGTNTPLGTTVGITAIYNGAVLDLNGFTLGTSEALTLNSTGVTGTLINSSATSVSYSGNITMAYNSYIGTNPGDITLTGVISGVFYLVKVGTGTLTISNSNTYTGATYITSGTLKLGAAGVAPNSPLGTIAGVTAISAGAVLDLNGFSLATTEVLYLNGTGISNSGALINSSPIAVTYSGLIRLYSASSIIANAGTISITNPGTLQGAAFGLTLGGSTGGTMGSIIGTTTGSLTKADAGTWTLSRNNTFSGGTTLLAGTLNINSANALGDVTGTFTISGGSIDNTSGSTITTADYPLVFTADFTYNGSVPRNLNLGSGTVTMSANTQITVNAGTLTIGGVISATSYNLTKEGIGTLSLGNNAVVLNNLLINSGTFISTSDTISLVGNYTNTGTFSHNSGTVYLNGTSAQSIGGTNPIIFNNLTINNANGVTLTNNALTTVSNTLTINNGKIFEIAAGKQLTVSGTLTNSAGITGLILHSDATGTASLIESTAGVSATVQRYILDSTYFHYISSPVTNATAIIFYYTYLYDWIESTQSWCNVLNHSDPLTPMKGFSLLHTNLSSPPPYPPANPIIFTGVLNTGTQGNINNLSYTNGSIPAYDGFNLMGNPYPSGIDWDAPSGWTKTNVSNAIYIWKQNKYATYINGKGTNGGTQYIGAHQGFYVLSTATGTLQMNNNVRTHTSASLYRSNPDNLLLFKLENDKISDETIIRFSYGASRNFDGAFDAYKLFSYNKIPHLYTTKADGVLTAINALPEIIDSTIVPMYIRVAENGNYKITVSGIYSFDNSIYIALEDTKTSLTKILVTDSTYSFYADTKDTERRFIVKFYKKSNAVGNLSHDDINIFSNHKTIFVNLNGMNANEMTIINMFGQTVDKKHIASNNQSSFETDLPTGLYIVKILVNGKSYDKKLFLE